SGGGRLSRPGALSREVACAFPGRWKCAALSTKTTGVARCASRRAKLASGNHSGGGPPSPPGALSRAGAGALSGRWEGAAVSNEDNARPALCLPASQARLRREELAEPGFAGREPCRAKSRLFSQGR